MKATFEADFSNFNNEVDKSVTKMKSIEQEANQVNVSLNKMVDQFSGQKVIEQANAMALAVTAIGGASKLSEADLRKFAATTADAADRFLAFTGKVPVSMQVALKDIKAAQDASTAYKTTVESWAPALIDVSEAMGTTGNAFGQFSHLLAEGGVHIRGQVSAIKELIDVANAASGSIGAFGTTGLVVGTALAGWELGKKIDEVVHLSDDVQYLAEAMGGFARETEVAAAQQELLAAASRIVKEQILSVAEATEILAEAQRAMQRTQAPGETADQIKKWAGELALVNQSGVLKSLEADLKSHNFTLHQLSELYHVSVEALQYFQRWLAETDRAVEKSRKLNEQHDREWRQQLKDQDEALAKHVEAVKKANEALLRPIEGEGTKVGKPSPADLLGIGQRVPQSALDMLRKAGFTGGGVAGPSAEDLQNPFTQLAETTRKLNEEMDELVRAGNTRNEAAQALAADRKKAMDVFMASLLAAAKAADELTKSLKPKEAETLLPWSGLGVKPITVPPIRGSFFDYGPAGMGVNQPFTNAEYERLNQQINPQLNNLPPVLNTTINVSGVLDPRTMSEITAGVGKELARNLGRQLPNA